MPSKFISFNYLIVFVGLIGGGQALASVTTNYCVNVNDFVMPTAANIAKLHAVNANCVRFDLIPGLAPAQIQAYRAAGFGVMGISPYVPLGTAPTQSVFDQDASFVQTVAPSLMVLELMNEPNNEGPLSEAQLSPSQYIAYAQTIARAARAANPGLFISSGGTSGYDPGWLAATIPALKASGSIDCVGVHPYGVAANQFGRVWATVANNYGLPACETEVGNTSGNLISGSNLTTSLSQSDGVVPLFVYFNLDELLADGQISAAFAAHAAPLAGQAAALSRVVFNPDWYLQAYPDLRAAFGNNTSAATTHWLNYGIREGRQGALTFSAVEYLGMYSDLRAAFGGSNYLAGIQHYINNGISEGRGGRYALRSEVFSASWYLQNYPDLQAAFGLNTQAATEHWLNNGIREGRQASPSFSSKNYLARYSDLTAAFGPTNDQAAIMHYLFSGIPEGRNGQ